MAFVYWIRAPHHTDILGDGYVGVTIKAVTERFRQHRSAAKRGSKLPIHKAMRESEMVCEVLVVADEAYCYALEAKLRPIPRVGLNTAAGGEVSPTTGRKHTDATLAKQRQVKLGASNPNYGKKISPEHGRKISAANSGDKHFTNGLKSYQLKRSNLALWADAAYLYDLFIVAGGCGMRKLATLCGHKYTADNLETIAKQFNSGWNPSEDSQWLDFVAEYNLKG